MAKHLERTPGLTIAHPPRIAEAIAQSYEGMAHFAGTGPRGATCGGCIHWGNGTGQEARERGCSKDNGLRFQDGPEVRLGLPVL